MKLRYWTSLACLVLLLPAALEAAVWASKAVGGTTMDDFESLIATRDGGYLGVGGNVYIQGFTFTFRSWVAKMDANGAVKWHKVLTAGWIDDLDAALETSDGSYVIAGDVGHKGYVAKLASSGNVLWEWFYPGPNTTGLYSIRAISSGGYIAAGAYYNTTSSSFDAWVLNLDSAGQVVWQKAYGGAGSDYAYDIQTTSDGGFLVGANTDSTGAGDTDAWIMKLDSAGTVLWQQTYGGVKDDFSHRYSLAATGDGGCVIAGSTESYGAGNEDGWILKLNSSGGVVWQKAVGGSKEDVFYSVRQTSDKGFIVAGETESFGKGKDDAWIVKFNSAGQIQWQTTHGGTGSDGAKSILQLKNRTYLAGGHTSSYGIGSGDGLVLRIATTGFTCTPLTKTSTGKIKTTSVQGKLSTLPSEVTASAATSPSLSRYTIIPKSTVICMR